MQQRLYLSIIFSAFASTACAQFGPSPVETRLPSKENAVPAPIVKTEEIPVEPRVIDPVQFMPEALRKKVTVAFDEVPLRELIDWVKENISMPVIVDEKSLTENGIGLGEFVSDHLDDEPLFYLLNRLGYQLDVSLGWYVEDEVLHITTREGVEDHLITATYDISKLTAIGYGIDELLEVFQMHTSGPWFDIDGLGGTIDNLGEVLFVRQTLAVHREIQLFLTGLESHALKTDMGLSLKELELESLLDKKFSIDLKNERFDQAVAKIGKLIDADVRLDLQTLEDNGIRSRDLTSVSLPNVKLRTIIQVLSPNVELTGMVRDGVMWITTKENSEEMMRVSFFDVRDLSRDNGEVDALIYALMNHTGGPWFDVDGLGGLITAPDPGVLIVRAQAELLHQVETTLQVYRSALKNIKPQEGDVKNPLNEMVTRYYRLNTETATSLETALLDLIEPASWQREMNDAQGKISRIAVGAELLTPDASKAGSGVPPTNVTVDKSVLIIHQSLRNHITIGQLIASLQTGDSLLLDKSQILGGFSGSQSGGMGGQGGFSGGSGGFGGQGGMGFGGGFFKQNSKSSSQQ